jgi:toxin ParE1/3/4
LRLVWSPASETDLLQLWSYLATQASIAAADEQIRKIRQSCEVLRDWPLSGPARDALIPGMRSVAVTPYVVFYRVAEDAVEVVRVLHGRRDIEAIFDDSR